MPSVWNPNLSDTRYRNPVIYADYSDPDVVRDGQDYYLTASSMNCTPCLPILHSRDLVNWTIVNYAVKNVPGERYRQVQNGCGVWAPSIRKHAGKFWIFFPTPDEGIYVTCADDPRGKWSEPWLLLGGRGLIDPCPLWDEDGKAYLVHAYAGSRAGIKHLLRVRPMAADASRCLGEGEIVFYDPFQHKTMEGPKFDKFNGMYYILAPAGGVTSGWQVVMRSKNVYGPYEDKIVLAQGSTPINGPHQGALVDTPEGEWWFVHFQDAGAFGRITHLQPVRWVDGWPMMGINQNAEGVGEPVLEYAKPKTASPIPTSVPQTSDEFDSPTLGLQWQWHANHQDDWYSLSERSSFLRLRALKGPDDLGQTPHLLMQKFPAPEFVVETEVHLKGDDLTAQTGLIITGEQSAALVVANGATSRRLLLIIGNQIVHEQPLHSCGGVLRVEVGPGGICQFSFREKDGQQQNIGETFQAKKDIWIGAKVGLFCRTQNEVSNSYADIDYFRILPR